MTESEAAPAGERPGPSPRPADSIRGSIERLLASGQEVVEAEVAWAKLKGQDLAKHVRRGLLFATISVVCLIVGLALLLVAGVVALAPVTGLLGATLIVSLLAFIATVLFGLLARGIFDRMIEGDEP